MQRLVNSGQVKSEYQFDDLVIEFHEAIDRGEPVDPDAFVQAHPEFRHQLGQYFSTVAIVEQLAGPASAQDTDVVGDATVNNGLAALPVPTRQANVAGSGIEGNVSHAEPAPGASTGSLATDSPPTEFGRYRILRTLGSGAMGTVYLAEDDQVQRQVALKIPKYIDGIGSELLDRLYREARSAGNLRHPGICPVFDIGEIDGQHFIAMAYIKGQPLSHLTESGRTQKVVEVTRIVQKIALAMAAAHKQGVIHRDLKPANVILDTEGEPVVTDFGLARRKVDHEGRLTQPGMVIGSPAYMSPEQVDGDNTQVGPSADIYSLGVIFYELLTGGVPFQGSLVSTLRQISMDAPRPLNESRSDIDLPLQTLCHQMLAKRAEDRPPSMQQVADRVSNWLNAKPVADGEVYPQVSLNAHSSSIEQADTQQGDITAPADAIDTLRSACDPVVLNKPRLTRKRRVLIAAGLGSALLLLAGVIFFVNLGGRYEVSINVADPGISLKVDDETVVIDGADTLVRLSAGTHSLHVELDGFETETDEFTVKSDDKNLVHVAVVNGKLSVLKGGGRPEGVSDNKIAEKQQVNPLPSTTKQQNQLAKPKVKPAIPEHSDGGRRLLETAKTSDASDDWALQFGSRSSGYFGAGFGFVVRKTPIRRDQDFTIEFWCRLSDRSGERTLSHPPFSFGVRKGRAIARHAPADRSRAVTQIEGPVITNRWVHRALVVEGNEMRQYVNGVLAGSAIIPKREDTWSDMPHFGLKTVGEIDEVRISNVARYGATSFTPEHRHVPDEAALGIFHFDEGDGVDLTDASGHTVGIFASGSNGFTRLKWVKADRPTLSDDENGSSKAIRP